MKARSPQARAVWERLGATLAMAVAVAVMALPATAARAAADDKAAGGGGGPAAQAPPPALVHTATAQRRPLQARWDAIGRLQEVRRATVAAEVAGRALAVNVDAGDTIVGGQTVLAEIDGVWAKLRLAQAQADVAAAGATLDQSTRDLQYLEELAQVNSAKPKEVADARARAKADEARLGAALALREQAQEEVARLKVLAPFDGAVVEKLTEVGQWIQVGAPIAQVISTGAIDAVIDVPERYIAHIKVGDAVPLMVQPLKLKTQGTVQAIVPTADNAARTFPTKVRLEDARGRLRPGMSVVAYVPMGREKQYLTVPRDAVHFRPEGAVVWVAARQGPAPMPSAVPAGVEVLFAQGDVFAVEAGPGSPLQDGVTVVVEGMEALFPGRPLIVQGAAPAGSADTQGGVKPAAASEASEAVAP